MPKKHQNDPRSTQKRPQNEPKATPRRPKKRPRTTRRQENRTKTILGPSWIAQGPICIAQRPLPGLHLGGQIGTKIDPKTIKNRSEKSRDNKNRSKTILGPSWGDLGPSWVPSWGPGNALALRLPMFREHSLFRC